MRSLLFFCSGLLLVAAAHAQERVRNVRIRASDSSQLEIRYDLVSARPGDSIYVEVKSRLRGTLRILPEFVRGDWGERITVGSNRRIVWNALANGYSLNEDVRATVLVKTGLPTEAQPARNAEPVAAAQPAPNRPAPGIVEKPSDRPRPTETTATAPVPAPRTRPAEPVAAVPTPADATRPQPGDATPDTVASQKKRYAGPAWALLSAVAPGFGNIFVQTPKPKVGLRPLVAATCYGLLAYGFGERQKSRDAYAVYEQQKNAETGEPYYQTANSYYHRYYLATRGALVIAAADVILTFFKGLRNGQATARNRPLQSLLLRPGLQVGQPTAVVRYSF